MMKKNAVREVLGAKNKFSFKEQYKLSWKYLRRSKNFILWALGIFFAFALFGFFTKTPDALSDQIMEYIRKILLETEGMNQLQLTIYIFLNNLKSSFLAMIFGFVFGIFPVMVAALNGFVVGFVSLMSSRENGLVSLLNLLPHGIFELPAIFISIGLGIKFGTFMFGKNKSELFGNFLINSLRVFVFIIIPLLIIAAIIEGWLIFL